MRRAAPLFARATMHTSQSLPHISLPPVPGIAWPTPAETAVVTQTTARISALAAAQWRADACAARETVPQPARRGGAAPSPRLLAQWRPGAWTGAQRRLAAPTTEVLQTRQGPFINSHAEQHLVMLWAPVGQRSPRVERWPSHAFLCGANGLGLDEAVLAQVPENKAFWWLPDGLDLVDWALACELMLRQHDLLRPFQVSALRALLAGEAKTASAPPPAPDG